MRRAPATFRQSDLDRAIRAAKKAGAAEVLVPVGYQQCDLDLAVRCAERAGACVMDARIDENGRRMVLSCVSGPTKDVETSLYRHFDRGGALLYVGIAIDPIKRLYGHSSVSDWYDQIDTIKIERYPSRKTALAAEVEAIRIEKPLYNTAHHPENEVRARVRREAERIEPKSKPALQVAVAPWDGQLETYRSIYDAEQAA